MLDQTASSRDLLLTMAVTPSQLQMVASSLSAAGLDLFQAFSVASFNRQTAGRDHLPTFGRRDALGAVVGNTAALWDAFRRHLRDPATPSIDQLGPDPLDAYVEMQVATSLEMAGDVLPTRRWAVFYAHQLVPRPIPIQRIAEVADLARLGPAHLSIHPTYGPWIALRAVICFDLSAPGDLQSRSRGPGTCDGCEAPCREAFGAAREGRPLAAQTPAPASLSAEKARWLAVRNVCPAGAAYRYGEAQILYHYDKRRDVLLTGGSTNADVDHGRRP